jgi:hypothetical protein
MVYESKSKSEWAAYYKERANSKEKAKPTSFPSGTASFPIPDLIVLDNGNVISEPAVFHVSRWPHLNR